MRTCFTAVVVGLVTAGCASNAATPSQEERQALAPTGKLRVALYAGAPASIVQSAMPQESKGVGFDLGKDLARRIGVPFEPVVYPSPGAIMIYVKPLQECTNTSCLRWVTVKPRRRAAVI